MRTKLLPLIVFPALVGVAHAQSSVTLYGVINQGVNYINNQGGGSVFGMVKGQTNGSRWGFRGAEDLGGGMKAVFDLENGFDASAGTLSQGGRLFGRSAWMGLQTPYGRLTMGRQYDAMHDDVGEPLGATGIWAWIGSHQGDFDNLNANFRWDSSIRYISPTFAGFKFDGVFAPGGTPGNFATNRRYQLAMTYASGPVLGVIAYENINNPAVSVYDSTVGPADPKFTSPGKSPSFSGFLSANSQEIFAAGIGYRFGTGGQVSLIYTRTIFSDMLKTSTTPNTGSATLSSYEANIRYRLVPTLMVAAAYDYTTVRAPGRSAHYHQVIAGPDYFLSKATDIQLAGVWQEAAGKDSTGKAAVATIGSLGASTTPTQVAVKLTLRHRF
ncbi:porin [Paraburkholderia sp. UYCP14C]|uniref:porin n=1 Tax=Paraburkholderia sp. UYCP14C TaxID=2511130 RepID=UPI00101FF597|nr:porin [Paraburkholderia sp. UYCP14C]RZF25198.1 porin [Paraburkholderia sp. UYCP14C]